MELVGFKGQKPHICPADFKILRLCLQEKLMTQVDSKYLKVQLFKLGHMASASACNIQNLSIFLNKTQVYQGVYLPGSLFIMPMVV